MPVLVGTSQGSPPTLCALSGKRWLRPLNLPDVVVIASIARLEDARWLIAGRGADGRGYAAIYSPLDWEIERLPAPDIRAFVAVAEARSVSRAARALYLTQPAVTRRMQRLESALGVTLCDRTRRPVTLTEAGQTVLEPGLLVEPTAAIAWDPNLKARSRVRS